ncbi:hypothetical protein SK355_13920 [Candidatus Fukatsuia symbiotica]|uniref:Uncharacterized protein n=1 Tax=Candidatus Fukatsuia symbiotica TaxID=1878942 RepID=A0A2U8I952_9GAMM|nr:hypothetical protein [Candidatus Fukatsuia symbiotica]AWK15598.1 hypothetical protein CCS41_14350 [Candidatus Fukatsuia symbiotica]MEA9446245.1 hypothetical protein [Candidatus Fukatsuia symbiotica]
MNDSIKNQIKELISLLNDPHIKSKQAAFNACFEQLTRAKELASWETIAAIINTETGIVFDAKTASNMYGRTKKKYSNEKVSIKSKIVNLINKNNDFESTKIDNNETYQNQKRQVSNPDELRKIRSRTIDLDELKNGD